LGWRRTRLEAIVTGGELVFPVRRLPPHGLEAWATVLTSGYEGMVGKDEASPYRGGVTWSWLKVKVPGWTDPEDRWRRARGAASTPPFRRTIVEPGLAVAAMIDAPAEKALDVVPGARSRYARDVVRRAFRQMWVTRKGMVKHLLQNR
jgi:hypothetical protein